MVVARKSTAPGVVSAMAKVMGTPGTSGSNNPAEITANASGANPTTQETQLKPDDLNEAISQLTKSQIKLPPGTCLVPADAKCEQVLAPDQAQVCKCNVWSDAKKMDLIISPSLSNINLFYNE